MRGAKQAAPSWHAMFTNVWAAGGQVPAGRPQAEVQAWGVRHNEGVRAFHRHFYNASVGGYSPVAGEPRGSQTSNSMALALGTPPDAATRATVASALVQNTEVRPEAASYSSLPPAHCHCHVPTPTPRAKQGV